MPLSEHEQRLLSEMEQRLVADDPRFASAMRHASTGGRPKHRLVLGGLGVAAGLGVMLVSLYAHQVPFAVLGFAMMLASAYWAITTPTRKGPQGVVSPSGKVQRPNRRRPRSAGQGGQGGFVQRMEQRWERRRETGNPDA